jgi:hypothetical protein
MKKWMIFVLAVIVALSSWGCTAQRDKLQDPVHFYYLPQAYRFGTEDSVLAFEQRDGVTFRENPEALLRNYLEGPRDTTLRSPFPTGTGLIRLEIEGDTAYVLLSQAFSQLTGYRLTLACACVASTCLDYFDCVNVCISAENSLLDGEKSITLNAKTLLLYDTAVEQTAPQEK